jgi:WD40 repeat protein
MSGGITKWVVILQVVVMALGANAQEKPEVFVQLGHSGSVNSVSFSPDGKVLASGGEDNTVKLWDVASGKLIRSINAHIDAVNTVAFSPDGKILASGSGGEFGLKEASIKLWDVYNGKFLNELGTTILDRHTSRITSVAFSSDGKYLVSASIDKSIRLWDVSTGKILKILSGEIEINVIALSKDRKFLAAGLKGNSYFDYSKNSQITGNTIKVWDVMNGKLIWESNAVDSRVVSVAFSPDGKYLVSGELKKYDRVGGNYGMLYQVDY